jgi:hypothetical protein
MNKPRLRQRLRLGGVIALAAGALLAAALLLMPKSTGSGLQWLGPGPGLQEQVKARLQPVANTAEYDRTDTNDFVSTYLESVDSVKSWQVLQVQTENLFPLWESVRDDDPVYSLTVDLEFEYANGQRSRLRWSTWRYGLVLGPVVFSYGDGPPGGLTQLADSDAP